METENVGAIAFGGQGLHGITGGDVEGAVPYERDMNMAMDGLLQSIKKASQNFVRKDEIKLNIFFAPACTKRKIQIGL